MRSIVALVILLACAPCASAQSGVVSPDEKASSEQHTADDHAADKNADAPDNVRQSICLMVESAARANGLPLEFFARVIWQESRFKADAVGPRTSVVTLTLASRG